MRKFCFRILGILACAAIPLCADGFRESDDALLADKDFPFPPDESELPEMSPADEDNASVSSKNKAAKSRPSAKKQNKTKASKDIFPPNPE